MLFGDVIAIALSIIGFLFSLQGLWLVSHALWPARVEMATDRCAKGNLKCFLVGLPVTLVGVVVAAIVARAGTFGQLSAFAIALLYIVYANVGVAGLVTHIGRRLSSPVDADRPWKATVRGGIALEMAWLIPVLGWLGLLPISLIVGAGAMTLCFFTAARAPQTAGAWPAPALVPMAAPPPLGPASPAAIAAPPFSPRAQWSRPMPPVESRDLEPAAPGGVEG
jgi:hypothetical protein